MYIIVGAILRAIARKRGTLVQVYGLNISDHTTRDYPAECGMINGYVNSLLIIRSKHNVLLVLIYCLLYGLPKNHPLFTR